MAQVLPFLIVCPEIKQNSHRIAKQILRHYLGWSQMSGRRTSGSSRPGLGVQVLAVFSFISQGKLQFKKCLGKRLEVPDILLPDIRGLLTIAPFATILSPVARQVPTKVAALQETPKPCALDILLGNKENEHELSLLLTFILREQRMSTNIFCIGNP